MKKLFSVTLLLIVLSSPAYSYVIDLENKLGGVVNVGFTQGLGDLRDYYFFDTYHYGAGFLKGLKRELMFETRVNYTSFNEVDDSIELDDNFLEITGGLRYFADVTDTHMIYGAFGLGMYHYSAKGESSGMMVEDSSNNFGLNLGFGFMVCFSEKFFLEFATRYHLIHSDVLGGEKGRTYFLTYSLGAGFFH